MPLVRRSPGGGSVPTPDKGGVADALANGNVDERWAAARASASIPGSARWLGEAILREQDSHVREAIFTSLACINSAESVEVVLPLLRSDDAPLRTGALDALRTMWDVAQPYVPQLLRDDDDDVRLLACELVRLMPGEEGSQLLCALIVEERAANVCASAVEVLAEVAGPEALPALARCAERFRGTPFLEFSIRTTVDRIRSQASG